MVLELYLNKTDVHSNYFRSPEENLKRQSLCSRTPSFVRDMYDCCIYYDGEDGRNWLRL